MGLDTVIAGAVSAVLASLVTAWATLRGQQGDLLHASEAKFREALLRRVEQLEAHVGVLEQENYRLRLEIAVLKGAQ